MNLVDKHDGLTGVLLNLVQYGFQALLKIATVLRTGQQCRHVQHQNALVFQAVGHLAVDDALRQTLNDRGFTHARLTDQHRIVFAATLQNLDRAANLVVAANYRIELAAAGAFGQIQCVFFQCFTGVFCVWVVHVFPLSNAFNGGQQGLFIQAHAVQYFFQAVFALLVQQGEQQHFGRDITVAVFLRVLLGAHEGLCQVRGQHRHARGFHHGQALHRLFHLGAHARQIHAAIA